MTTPDVSPAHLLKLLRAVVPLAHQGKGPTTLKQYQLLNEARMALGQAPYAIPGQRMAEKVLAALRKHGPIDGEKLAAKMGWGSNALIDALWYLAETGRARRVGDRPLGRLLILGRWEALSEGTAKAARKGSK